MMRSQSDCPMEVTDLQAAQAWLNQGDVALPHVPAHEETIEEQRFLRFALYATATEARNRAELETVLLPLESIQEVSQIPQRGVLPVPDVPNAVLGIANCRGAVLWLVDLAQLLGLPSPEKPASSNSSVMESFSTSTVPSFHTLTVHAAGQSIGLVVPQVMDIESHDANDLHPPTTDLFPKYLLPFLAGHLGRSPVLSASALIENLQMQR